MNESVFCLDVGDISLSSIILFDLHTTARYSRHYYLQFSDEEAEFEDALGLEPRSPDSKLCALFTISAIVQLNSRLIYRTLVPFLKIAAYLKS